MEYNQGIHVCVWLVDGQSGVLEPDHVYNCPDIHQCVVKSMDI